MATFLKVAISLIAFVTFAESAPREKRQVTKQQLYQPQQQQYQPQQQYPGQQQTTIPFSCPNTTGQFPYPRDCTKFYRCDNGVATVTDCQDQLVFNPQAGFCDWPANVPSCSRPVSSSRQMFKPEIGNLCERNPYGGKPSGTFHVRHPQYCNAFFTCTQGFMHGLCIFCAKGEYFNRLAGGCRQLPQGIINTNSLCENTQMVRHKDKPRYTIGDSCWPFANRVNPWAALAQKLNQQQPYQPQQQQPQQPYQQQRVV
ncbi:hypothetical protein RRG08_022261 [Elysia crispata]|uniref:Chitin-binding type-2 domain-containing protein n=1 Tax=Elysia crispata TaxID=231223 RepID=A0AAE1DKW3_9GAST|nr:hypothetical protein RRG08_022261 [Elysia crispata]